MFRVFSNPDNHRIGNDEILKISIHIWCYHSHCNAAYGNSDTEKEV